LKPLFQSIYDNVQKRSFLIKFS